MSKLQAKTLFIPMLDLPKEYEDAANRWFDGDHVPQRLSCEGFLSCERFQLTDIEPAAWAPTQRWCKYLNAYEVENPAVLDSEAYRLQGSSSRNAATESKLEAGNPRINYLREQYRALGRGEFRHSTRSLRTLWAQRASPWESKIVFSLQRPRCLYVLLRDFSAAHEAEINTYVDNLEVPEILSCAGFLRCERYQVVKDLRGGANSQPAYMDVYDIATPEVATSDRYWGYRKSRSGNAYRALDSATVRGCGVYVQRPSPWAVTSVS